MTLQEKLQGYIEELEKYPGTEEVRERISGFLRIAMEEARNYDVPDIIAKVSETEDSLSPDNNDPIVLTLDLLDWIDREYMPEVENYPKLKKVGENLIHILHRFMWSMKAQGRIAYKEFSSKLIEKDKSGKWRVISGKTGKYWPAHYKTRKDAEAGLRGYFASKGK